ncbi:MAG: hypothetical protein KGH94_04365 [Candidatus Micrarchaeota archaeon]|nr:hypothetical protein [Candidatus Micrarchaeota archaeon]
MNATMDKPLSQERASEVLLPLLRNDGIKAVREALNNREIGRSYYEKTLWPIEEGARQAAKYKLRREDVERFVPRILATMKEHTEYFYHSDRLSAIATGFHLTRAELRALPFYESIRKDSITGYLATGHVTEAAQFLLKFPDLISDENMRKLRSEVKDPLRQIIAAGAVKQASMVAAGFKFTGSELIDIKKQANANPLITIDIGIVTVCSPVD